MDEFLGGKNMQGQFFLGRNNLYVRFPCGKNFKGRFSGGQNCDSIITSIKKFI